MKKHFLTLFILFQFFALFIFINKLNKKLVLITKLRLVLFFAFVSLSLWAQPPPHIFDSNGSLVVPAGITKMTVEAWGGGGAGGGASGATSVLGVVTGHAGAGGGGGAYATAEINVVSGLNLSVIVARQVSGSTGSGLTGETSTITGFENFIKAVGGQGGAANTTGGAPAGGLGGQASASSGTSTNGGDGGAGNTALLVGIKAGAGGTGAGPGGGSGGASIFGSLISVSGNVGSAPGGGGSGAVDVLLGGPQIGGAGAAGKVVVSYTCPTYSITTVTPTTVCAASGISTITLTGTTTANLPVGVYTITYTLDNPAENNSATMTVTTAGTGNFPLSGFTAVGTRKITITKLTSGACSSNSSVAADIITSPITEGGSIAGSAGVCYGSTSGLLSLSGNVGSVLSWESSVAPFSDWTTIPNITTSYTSEALTQTTQFRAVVQSSPCGIARSAPITVNVNPLPQGSLTGNGPFCAGGSPQLLFTATAGTGPYTIVYKENGGADRTATNISSGVSFAAFTTPVNSSITYTLVAVTDVNNCARSTGFTASSATIIVNPQSPPPIVGDVIQPSCLVSKGSVQLKGLISPAAWTVIQNGTFNNMYYGTGSGFIVPNLMPGNYTFTIQDATGCPSAPTTNVEIMPSVVNTWNGNQWSKGTAPNNDTDTVRFSGDFQTTGDVKGCSCIVDPSVNVVVNSNHTLAIVNAVNNNGGSLTFENDASLIQINSVLNSGDIIYKRNTTPVRRYDFTCWSSPVKRTPSFTLHDLSPYTLADKYFKYDGLNGWIIIYNGNEGMEVGKGYIVRAPQYYDITTPSVFNGTFVGVPNNGTISTPLATAEKWYLIGNPYPSAVYADQFIVDNKDNLYGTLYFWTHNSLPQKEVDGNKYQYNTNDYAIYNLTGSTVVGGMEGQGATTPGNQRPLLSYIAAGQSFFVKSKTAASAVFTNSMRVSGNNSQFYKSSYSNKENATGHRVWLNLTNTQGAFKQILIGYVDGATNSWDNNYDGLTMDGNKYLDFYSINEFMKLVIQGRALPFTETDIVPLGYRSAIQGEFTIAIDDANGDLSTHDIYLEDKLTKNIHNLKTSDYNFTTVVGTFDDRFVLHYTNTSLGTVDVEGIEQEIVVSVKEKIIKVVSTNENISEVSVFDITGRLVYNKIKVNAIELQINNLQSGNQVLLVKTTFENGKMVSKKVVF